jgi:ATP-binding cassette subfamily C protein EexD
MIASWKGFITARGQYQRLNEILLNIPVDKDKMQLPTPQGKLTLEAAVVIPPGAKKPVIKGLNLTVEQGDIVGVLGPSGAGKSTLARALLGIWPTRSGAIRLDGADVSAWDRQQLGEFIGYLPQDIELFEGSVSENIARFGEVKPEKVVEAAKMADVHELILHLSEGYDTAIGSGGMNLSAGQRQRIGLARALYNTPVLIVLDEPNSNLDEQGEKALKRCLQKLKVLNSTVIIVTHRSNILENVDKLLILKDGELVVYGAREKVIAHLQQKSLSMQSKA